jgi:uncharacterized membrane protein HdeD (DUF308 family)
MTSDLSRAVLIAPIIFVCHFVEESPWFVEWFNSHVARGITSGTFWRVNLTALMITLTVVAIEYLSRSGFSLTLIVGWLGFLMLANAVFHIVAAIVDRTYVPGLVTAILLYVPYYVWLFASAMKSRRSNAAILIAAAGLCSIPMVVHGYLIVFRGDRLF